MKILPDVSLRPYNTFGIEARARWLAAFRSADELRELLAHFRSNHVNRRLILGGGSNILLTGDFDGAVLKNDVPGMHVIGEDEEHVYVTAGAGENWHRFVTWCIGNGFGGVENLALIPGNVGASPMQNIGAYGVEIRDVFHELQALHLAEGHIRTFTLAECAFGYRDSVFKNRYRDQYAILNVTYRLSKRPRFNTTYAPLRQELERMGIDDLSLQAVAQAVINIRTSKLPDPTQIGNAGSFFKNPTLPNDQFAALRQKHPDVPAYPVDPHHTKVPAGWLIEQAGWKGFRAGDAGCYAKQALVLVNYGQASGAEILALSQRIAASVHETFGITLEREVNVI